MTCWSGSLEDFFGVCCVYLKIIKELTTFLLSKSLISFDISFSKIIFLGFSHTFFFFLEVQHTHRKVHKSLVTHHVNTILIKNKRDE